MAARGHKILIGVPVYNGEKVLGRTLDSLIAQSFEDLEIIISDNASTDGTEAICRDYAARDPRVRYIRQKENLGAVPNFNFLFQVANSKYFKWAAADDILDPTYLEKAVAILDENPEVVWCHSRSSHIDEDGEFLRDREALDVSYPGRQSDNPVQRFRSVLLGKKGCLDCAGLIRSEALSKTPLFLPYYGPEKVLIAELALMGRYREIPETLFYSRVLPEGSGTLKTAAEQQAFADARAKQRLPMTRLKYLFGYLRAIARSSPSLPVALASYFVVLQWLFQIQKWKRVVVEAFRGKGVGGRQLERIEQMRKVKSSISNPQDRQDARAPGPADLTETR